MYVISLAVSMTVAMFLCMCLFLRVALHCLAPVDYTLVQTCLELSVEE